jgi:hypothetical protein
MLQKEVVSRICAKDNTEDYGKLSILCQMVADVKKAFDVKPGSFFPPPKIHSSVVTLTPKQEQLAELIMKNNKFYKIICIGGAINMASGLEKPVPAFMERLNFEFIWRLRTDTIRRLRRLIVSAVFYFLGEISFRFKNLNKKILDDK